MPQRTWTGKAYNRFKSIGRHPLTRLYFGQTRNENGIREVTLAVTGANQAGKSTFIECALDLKRPLSAPIATKKVSLEGVISTLRLIEIPLAKLTAGSDEGLAWPETVGGQDTQQVDGALVVYDVMNQESFNHLSTILSEFPLWCGNSLVVSI